MAGLVALSMGAAGCSSALGTTGSDTVSLVAYSTPQKAFTDIVARFTATSQGGGTRITESYGASGAQSRAVIAGQPADVVEFSLQTDMTRLVEAGLVAPDWNSDAYHGMLTNSVVVLVVRRGNPKGIHTWLDLVRPGVRVVTPNPFSSGSARWNLMGAYGAQLQQGRSPAQALDFVKALLDNTVAQPESGNKATAAFVTGTGDVLISYENEAIEAQQADQPVDYVIPDETLLIENPVAVTTGAKNPALARQFLTFLRTDTVQRIFAEHGYRPVVGSALDPTRFPTPPKLFTIDDLGGWPKVAEEFFDPKSGSITRIENELGVGGG
jgi:sulfate/thiosulfate-binding protein